MKRDMDLARTIMLKVEEMPFDGGAMNLTNPDYPNNEISYHVMLLHEAGLIHAFDFSGDGHPNWKPAYLTWAGHEFLEAAKDETLWNRATSYLKEQGSPMMFEVLKTLLVSYVKQKVFAAKSS